MTVETRHTSHTTHAPAHQPQLTQLINGNFIIQLTDTRYDADTTFSVALYGTTEPVWPPCAGPKHHLSWGSLLPRLGLLAFPPKKKNYPMPTDDKAPQPCLSSLLIPAALSQVELYYHMSLSLSLSQHSNYVKYSIKQAKAQKQQ